MTHDECDRIFAKIRTAATPAEARHHLVPLINAYPAINIELGRASTFWRARVCGKEPWSMVTEMSYPQEGIADLGRLNDKGSPCFYAAAKDTTALAEIGANEGAFVQLAGYRIKPGSGNTLRLAVVGEMHHVQKMGYLRLTGNDPGGSIAAYLNGLERTVADRMLYIDAFFAELLSDPNAQNNGYMLSRIVASILHRNEKTEGIAFPSVKDMHGMNVGLRPDAADRKLQPVCCFHGRVLKVRSFGFIEYDVMHEAADITPDGTLVWASPQGRSLRRYFNLTRTEYEAACRSASGPPKPNVR